MPETKPDLKIDLEGVCSACRSFENRPKIDWHERKKDLFLVLNKYRRDDKWDCIIPVSGGKDSTYQVIKVLELGMNPLCVNSAPCDPSEIGKKNLENIRNLGVDMLQFLPNPIIRKKLNRIGLETVGDIAWPEHIGIFTIPVQVAIQYKIPLIIWGENAQNEYGGPASAQERNILDRRWLEEFGGLLGLRISDVPGISNINKKYLIPYSYPTDEEIKSVGVTGIFLGHYIPWDGLSNTLIASAYGFKTLGRPCEGSMVDYENLDNHQHGIHDYFKFLKFGFARTTDQVCLHIRRGRITREEGFEIVKQHDGKFPWAYLGKSLEEILKPLGISVDSFKIICQRFTNKRISKDNSK